MLRYALTEILWILILAFLFGSVALLLSGCAVEGAGFANNGAYANQTLCRYVDKRGNERWITVSGGRCS